MTKTTKLMDAELARLFARFDTNGDKQIDVGEFGLLLNALGVDASNDDVSQHFAAIDINKNGSVDFKEFSAWWLDHTAV